MNRCWAVSSALVLSLAGCATRATEIEGHVQRPESWQIVESNDLGCVPIIGNFLNSGIGYSNRQPEQTDARLDVLLGLPMPANRVPTMVSIRLLSDSDEFIFKFIEDDAQAFQKKVSCVDGWYQMIDEDGDAYIGDSVKLEESFTRIAIKTTEDNELVMHYHSNAQFKTFFLFKSRTRTEGWYLFRPVSKEIQ